MIELPKLDGWTFEFADLPKVDFAKFKHISRSYDRLYDLKRSTDNHDRFLIAFEGGATFIVDFSAERIEIVGAEDDHPSNTLRHFLVDHLIPRVLANLGQLVLHGSAINDKGSTFLVLGRTGMGKSTLAASFMTDGYGLIGDDALIIDSAGTPPLCSAVFRDLRLNPDSIDRLFNEPPATMEMTHYSNKKHVALEQKPDQLELPKRISAIFLLEGGADDGQIRITKSRAREACISLVENSFSFDPDDTRNAALRLRHCQQLTETAPTYCVTYPRDFEQLAEVKRALLDTLRDLD